MNTKKNIPHKFIIFNIIAALGVVLITHLTEPGSGVIGVIVFFAICAAFLIAALVFNLVNKIIDKSPKSLRAIRDCLSYYMGYLVAVMWGFLIYDFSKQIENPTYSKIFLVFTFVAISIAYVVKNYEKHYNNQK